MAGERGIGECSFLNGGWRNADTSLNRNMSIVSTTFYRLSGIEAQDHLMYLRLMSELVSIGAGTAKDMRERPAALGRKIAQVPKTCTLTMELIPAMERVYEEQLKMFARLRAARAGIAVERFRMANGRLPDSLDELAPKWLDSVPSDPFDDKPIRYKKLAKGFVTYSIGPDLKDHGGKESDPKDYRAAHDITFIVAR
jgi:hypothetical protein